MTRSLFDLGPPAEPLPVQTPERAPILYVEHNPDPDTCPYCGERFCDVVGCHKICRCGYMEGCGD